MRGTVWLITWPRTARVSLIRVPMIRACLIVLCISISVIAWPASGASTGLAQTPATAVSTPGDSFVGELLAIVIPLVLIIAGLLILLRMVRRRYGLSGSDAPLSVLQILPVGPRERLVLVKSRGGRVFAIGVGAQSVTFVADFDNEDLETPPSTTSTAMPQSPANIDGHR